MSAGSEMRKDIKLPAELMAQLGAFREAAKAIQSEMKEITKAITSREKDVAKLGDSGVDDAGLRELHRRRGLLEERLGKIESSQKESQDLGLRVKGLESSLSSLGNALHGLSNIANGRGVGLGELHGAGQFLQRAGSMAVERASAGTGAMSMASGVQMAKIGFALSGAAVAAAPFYVAAKATQFVMDRAKVYIDRQRAAADAGAKIADATLKELQADSGVGGIESGFSEEISRLRQTSYNEGVNAITSSEGLIQHAENWMSGTVSQTASAFGARQSMQDAEILKLGRVLGNDFVKSLQIDTVRRENRHRLSIMVEQKLTDEGYYGLGAWKLYAGYAVGIDARAQVEQKVILDMRQQFMNAEMRRREAVSNMESLIGSGPVAKTTRRQREIFTSQRRWRDYETSLQWNFT